MKQSNFQKFCQNHWTLIYMSSTEEYSGILMLMLCHLYIIVHIFLAGRGGRGRVQVWVRGLKQGSWLRVWDQQRFGFAASNKEPPFQGAFSFHTIKLKILCNTIMHVVLYKKKNSYLCQVKNKPHDEGTKHEFILGSTVCTVGNMCGCVCWGLCDGVCRGVCMCVCVYVF